VAFANPPWAQERQMVTADAVDITIDLRQVLQGSLLLPTVHLLRPVVFLEQNAQGQKNWLLDDRQVDETARIRIGQLTLDQGVLGFDDLAAKTHIRAEISTTRAPSGATFHANGHYRGLSLVAIGTGGPVLALRDEGTPYPLDIDTTIGHTRIQAFGTVTGLVSRSAVNMNVAVSGHSLEQLYPLLGIPAPATHPYALRGQLVHSGAYWRYEAFTGRIGNSDIAGMAHVVTGGKRPALTAELASEMLDLGDLAPAIGVRSASGTPAPAAATRQKKVLPNVTFKTDRWSSMNADVRLQAKHLHRATALPLNDLSVHITLRDSVLTLDPLDVGVAGGHVLAQVSLDGSNQPIKAKARAEVRKVLLSGLFPELVLSQATIGQINGTFTLSGSGSSIASLLATSNGHVALDIAHGEVSQLMMEKAGLHLWEIMGLSVTGDKRIALRCGLARLSVSNGVMQADTLILDTAVTTLVGSGQIDLANETLALTLNPKTKNTSPLALRSPIYIRGSFAQPSVGVDKGRVAVRALGALALGLANPALALIPLVDPGPGKDSDCGHPVATASGH
jgi:AsmA protein